MVLAGMLSSAGLRQAAIQVAAQQFRGWAKAQLQTTALHKEGERSSPVTNFQIFRYWCTL